MSENTRRDITVVAEQEGEVIDTWTISLSRDIIIPTICEWILDRYIIRKYKQFNRQDYVYTFGVEGIGLISSFKHNEFMSSYSTTLFSLIEGIEDPVIHVTITKIRKEKLQVDKGIEFKINLMVNGEVASIWLCLFKNMSIEKACNTIISKIEWKTSDYNFSFTAKCGKLYEVTENTGKLFVRKRITIGDIYSEVFADSPVINVEISPIRKEIKVEDIKLITAEEAREQFKAKYLTNSLRVIMSKVEQAIEDGVRTIEVGEGVGTSDADAPYEVLGSDLVAYLKETLGYNVIAKYDRPEQEEDIYKIYIKY